MIEERIDELIETYNIKINVSINEILRNCEVI